MSDEVLEGGTQLVRTTIFNRLRADILSCVLRPGSQLQERQLVERYEVSKSPIRDALLKLEEENLVEVLPRKGYRVNPISLADAHELYDMRHMLERECILRMIDNAPARVIEALDDFRMTIAPTDLPNWIEYNTSFHTYLAVHSGNKRLARISCNIIDQAQRLTYVSVTSTDQMDLTNYVSEHETIIDAIQRRDRRQATALARDHIDNSRRRVFEALGNATVIA
jgi:GntR family transcriptional regulator, rspAB operon transcriptional repressor